jgi:hypothetical protein
VVAGTSSQLSATFGATAVNELWLWWLRTRSLLLSALSTSFNSLVLLISSNLWKERNSRTFDRTQMLAAALLETIATDSWHAMGFKALALHLARTG